MGDVTKVLRDLGISTHYRDGTCRSIRDILEDLNNLWDKLTEKQKDQICYIMLKGENSDEE